MKVEVPVKRVIDHNVNIRIRSDETVEPLGVAKLLKGAVEAEAPRLVLLGKQAIDDASNQTGQMRSALLGWSQATFASEIALGDSSAQVTEFERQL